MKYADALSFTFVKDILAPGAFDEAVKGVDGVSWIRFILPVISWILTLHR